MNKLISKASKALLLIPAMALVLSFAAAPAPAYALGISDGANSAQGDDQRGNASCLFGTEEGCQGQTGLFRTITNILLFIIGAISVIMLVVGGIRYTISGGDQNQVTAAKNTIMYAIVGIVVAILAYAVVNFVISSLK